MPAGDGRLLFVLKSMFKEKVVIFQKTTTSEALFFTLRISQRIKFLIQLFRSGKHFGVKHMHMWWSYSQVQERHYFNL
jgi:hypothetical protein